MDPNQSVRFAGDVSIEDITVFSSKFRQNITNQVLAIEIFEDLFSPFMSGTINIEESFDFINLFPFIGDEYVSLNIYTPTIDDKHRINQLFYIYKVSDRIIMGDRTVIYQLHIISEEALFDINKNHSKSYSGIISDIAKSICIDNITGLQTGEGALIKKPINIETTRNKTKFISNFWSPVKCLNYACATAISTTGASNYLFFENRNGLNFLSMDSLYKQPAQRSFVYDKYLRDIQADGRSIINIDKDYTRILSINVPVLYDYFDRLRTGMFTSKMLLTDVTTKRYNVRNFNILNDFGSNSHTNSYPAVTDYANKWINKPNALVIDYPKAYASFNNYNDVSNASSIQKRISQLAQAQTTKININVFGRTDYTVGMKVSVDLNQMRPIQKTETRESVRDNILSGNYIISAISHNINRKQHECVLELIKDSFIIDLNTGKP